MPKNKRTICIIYIAVYFLFFWVAGLFSYTVRNYGDKDGLSMNIGLSVVQDKMGYIWIASFGGLYRFNGDKMTGFTTSDGLPADYINTLYMDNTQNMWIGSQKGSYIWVHLPPGLLFCKTNYRPGQQRVYLGWGGLWLV